MLTESGKVGARKDARSHGAAYEHALQASHARSRDVTALAPQKASFFLVLAKATNRSVCSLTRQRKSTFNKKRIKKNDLFNSP